MSKVTRSCENCHIEFSFYESLSTIGKGRFCSRSCATSVQLVGEGNPRWNGGKTTANGGYILVKAPEGHPYADRHGYVREHRLVMEKKLGRYLLPHEDVDHINCIKTDNRPENLQLMSSRSEHLRIEHKKGTYKDHLKKLNNKELLHV